MTASEIRAGLKNVDALNPEDLPYSQIEMLGEIAAQLAELNQLGRRIVPP